MIKKLNKSNKESFIMSADCEDEVFVPAILTSVASEKLQKEVEAELKIPDPSEKSVAKLLEDAKQNA